jgi:F-type H+/Na+-transporting ATPase subunit alpha
MIIYAANNGYLDDVPVDLVAEWESSLYRYMDSNHPEIGEEIIEKSVDQRNKMSDDLLNKLGDAIEEYKKTAAPRPQEEQKRTASPEEAAQAAEQTQQASS